MHHKHLKNSAVVMHMTFNHTGTMDSDSQTTQIISNEEGAGASGTGDGQWHRGTPLQRVSWEQFNQNVSLRKKKGTPMIPWNVGEAADILSKAFTPAMHFPSSLIFNM